MHRHARARAVSDRLELLRLGQLRGEHSRHVLLMALSTLTANRPRLAGRSPASASVVLEAHEREQRVERQRAQALAVIPPGPRRRRW